jgi:hypothetical protein
MPVVRMGGRPVDSLTRVDNCCAVCPRLSSDFPFCVLKAAVPLSAKLGR